MAPRTCIAISSCQPTPAEWSGSHLEPGTLGRRLLYKYKFAQHRCLAPWPTWEFHGQALVYIYYRTCTISVVESLKTVTTSVESANRIHKDKQRHTPRGLYCLFQSFEQSINWLFWLLYRVVPNGWAILTLSKLQYHTIKNPKAMPENHCV